MKTSNKILSAGLGLFVISMLSGMVFYKKNMIITRLDKSYKGNGVEKTVELATFLQGDTLVLTDNYSYVLNPTSTKVSVTSDANLVGDIKLTNKNKLRFYREGHINFEPSDFTRVEIGIEGKSELVLILKDEAKLNCKSAIASDLIVVADDNSQAHLEVNGGQFIFELEDRAGLIVSGEADYVSIIGEDNALVKAKELKVSKLVIDLSDRAKVNASGAATVDIYLENRAILNFDTYWTDGPVKIEDRARFKISDSFYDPRSVIRDNGN